MEKKLGIINGKLPNADKCPLPAPPTQSLCHIRKESEKNGCWGTGKEK
jgi:hypothetical protein